VAAKTKSVGGKEYPASAFAYVGDLEDINTWHLLDEDADHVRDAMARFDQTQLPADAKAKTAKRLLAKAKKFGIDAAGFAAEHNLKTAEAAEPEESYEEQQQELDQALLDGFGLDTSGYRRFCLVETFPDYVIARGPDGDLYQISYTDEGDEIKFGEPQEVETAYVPVQESVRFMAAGAGSDDGLTWPIQVMESGWARGAVGGHGGIAHYFPLEAVAQVAQACNSARFGRRHPETDAEEMDPGRIAGYIDGGKLLGNTAVAMMHLFENEKEIKTKLVAARDAGKLDLFGASILAYFAWRPGKPDGKDALVAQKLGKLMSVDFVTEAGAGGKFLAYSASRSMLSEVAFAQRTAVKKVSPGPRPGESGSPQGAGRNQGGASMKQSILKVLEALRRIDAGSASDLAKEFENCPEDKQFEFFAKVSEAVTAKLPAAVLSDAPAARAAADLLSDAAKAALAGQNNEVMLRAQEALADAKKITFAGTLERKLTESKLPMPAQSLVREHFKDIVTDDKSVDGYIAKVRESFAAFTQVGTTTGSIEVGRNSQDKIQLAMDALLGVKEARADRNVKPFRGIREAYQHISGDRECSFGQGGFFRVSEAIATTDFPNILLNSLTKKLIQDYAEFQIVPGLEKLYTTTRLTDYKPQDRVRLGYLSDLPTVAEAGAYTELTKPTDEKITYSIGKKGGLLTISEETIRNDDLNKIAQFPNRLARAARHTLATFVTNFFITPPNYDPDGLAWFHATHANTGTTALSSAELDVRAIALAKQSEKDSTNRLGLTLDWIMIPIDLRPTAMQINRNMLATNNWYSKFGANEENIIVNPLLTDVTDWYGGSMPANAPFLEIGFLDGYETPQIFLANLPTQGTQFTNDQLQYKVKYVFGGKPIDFRGVFKEVVAG
jgi:hypothetical protein